jgi:hypothetical protein
MRYLSYALWQLRALPSRSAASLQGRKAGVAQPERMEVAVDCIRRGKARTIAIVFAHRQLTTDSAK